MALTNIMLDPKATKLHYIVGDYEFTTLNRARMYQAEHPNLRLIFVYPLYDYTTDDAEPWVIVQSDTADAFMKVPECSVQY